jgi:hypothetical protein
MVVRKVVLFAVLVALGACQSAPPAAPLVQQCPQPEPVQCPQVPPAEPCPPPPLCPTIDNAVRIVAAPAKSGRLDGKMVVGEVEFVDIQPGNLHLEARIDSGAKTSSLSAVDIVPFERDGRRWVRFKTANGNGKPVQLELPWERHVRIKGEGNDYERRPVVLVDLRLGSRTQRIQVTLTDRGNYEYPVLLGRNFLRDNVLIDVSRAHLQGKK